MTDEEFALFLLLAFLAFLALLGALFSDFNNGGQQDNIRTSYGSLNYQDRNSITAIPARTEDSNNNQLNAPKNKLKDKALVVGSAGNIDSVTSANSSQLDVFRNEVNKSLLGAGSGTFLVKNPAQSELRGPNNELINIPPAAKPKSASSEVATGSKSNSSKDQSEISPLAVVSDNVLSKDSTEGQLKAPKNKKVDTEPNLTIETDKSKNHVVEKNVRPALINGNKFKDSSVPLDILLKGVTKAKMERVPVQKGQTETSTNSRSKVYKFIEKTYILKKSENNNFGQEYPCSKDYKKMMGGFRNFAASNFKSLETNLSIFQDNLNNLRYIIYSKENSSLKVLGFFQPYFIDLNSPFLHPNIPTMSSEQFESPLSQHNIETNILSFDGDSKYIDCDQEIPVVFRIVNQLFEHLNNKCTNLLSTEEAFETIYNYRELRSSPGFPFCYAVRSKGDCLDWIHSKLIRLAKNKRDDFLLSFPPVLIGGQHFAKGDVRGVWIYPAPVNILERRFTNGIYDKIIDPQNWEYQLPFKLPYQNYHSKLLTEGRSCCEFEILNIHCGSSHYIINFCFRVLHKWCFEYEEGKGPQTQDTKLFQALKMFLIRTPIVLPSGQFIKKDHGIAFGSEFSLVVASLVATFIGVYCMVSQGVEVYTKENEPKSIAVLGNSISLSVPSTFSIVKLIKDVESLGYKVDGTSINFIHSESKKESEIDEDSFEVFDRLDPKNQFVQEINFWSITDDEESESSDNSLEESDSDNSLEDSDSDNQEESDSELDDKSLQEMVNHWKSQVRLSH